MNKTKTIISLGAVVVLTAGSFAIGRASSSNEGEFAQAVHAAYNGAGPRRAGDSLSRDGETSQLKSDGNLLAQADTKVRIKSRLPFAADSIADIAEAAAPAVVNIEVDKQIQSSSLGQMFGLPFDGFENFEFFYNGKRVSPDKQMPKFMRKNRNTGSGFVVRPDGYILTNAHVVKDASKIEVTFSDGKSLPATVVGTDSFSDLAVIKVEAAGLPSLPMGTSKGLRPGEFAVAIGSPLGYDHTVTLGIVSAVGRTVTDVNGNINFIQTDAAINRGNSGGPLLNLEGEVIGVNTAIVAGAQNIGFSIPIDIAKSVSSDLIAHKKILRPWLGIAMQEVTDVMAKSLGMPAETRGVLVAEVFEGSPAEKAGLAQGDIIQKIDGKEMSSPKEIQDYVRSKGIDDSLNFFVLRKGAAQAFAVNIGEYPEQRPIQ